MGNNIINANIMEIPKIELHAHLNGSLSNGTLRKLHSTHGDPLRGEEIEWPDFEKDLSTCFDMFNLAYKLTRHPQSVTLATYETIKDFAEESVVYVELRTTPRAEPGMTKAEYLLSVVQGVLKAKSEIPQITAVVLVSINRRQCLESAEENVALALRFKETYPEIFVGLDFSGDPSKNKFLDFKDVLERARKNGLKTTVHFAEIENDEETAEIIKFGADRLGHGVFLSDENWDSLQKSGTPVELCITSNVRTGSVPDAESHHVKQFLERNHPFVLATDDKGVFDTSLSKEYMLASEVCQWTVEDIWNLNKEAIAFTFASDQVRNRLHKVFDDWKNSHLQFFGQAAT